MDVRPSMGCSPQSSGDEHVTSRAAEDIAEVVVILELSDEAGSYKGAL